MIDETTTDRNYPLPHPNNKLNEDVIRIRDSFEDISVDVDGLLQTTAALTTKTDEAQSGSTWYAESTGSANAYIMSLDPSLTSINAGFFAHMRAHSSNTGPATLDVNSTGPKAIKKTDGNDLKAGDIISGAACFLFFDGINFQLINPKVDQEQTETNTSNIMRAFEEIQENHGGSLNMETGWSDSFSNANEQGADEANSSGFEHDASNKLYKGTDPGTGLSSDKNYDTEANYLQQEWTNTTGAGTSQATVTIGSATVTLSTGDWPTNAANSRISFDSGSTWYKVSSRDSSTQITLASNATEATTDYDYIIQLTDISNGQAQLVGTVAGAETTVTDISVGDTSYTTTHNTFTFYTSEYFGFQSFTPTQTGTISSFEWLVEKYSGISYTSQTWIYASDANDLATGPVLATSDNIATSTYPSPHNFVEYTFSGSEQITLNAGTKYVAKLIATSGHTATYTQSKQNMGRSTSNTYSGGKAGRSDQANNTHSGITFESAGTGNVDFAFRLNLIVTPTTNPIDEYVSITDTEAQKTDSSAWSNVNSSTVAETLNSQNAYYWLAFDPTSAFGIGTEIKIFNAAGSVWRKIARNNGGIWEYNNNATDDAVETWIAYPNYDMLHAISKAIELQTANRMTGVGLSAITDAQWEETGGWSTSVSSIIRGVTLHSNSSSQNPSVSQYSLNYDSERGAMDLKSKAYDPGFIPSEAYVWCRAEHSDADGSGTFSVSRNSGASWEVVPMAQHGLAFGDIRIMRGTVDLGAQPSGQDLRCRYQTAQGKDHFLHSWGLQAKG